MSESIPKILGSDQPLKIFKTWWEEAKDNAYESAMNEGTAMTLSTVNAQGQPRSRVVLLKELTDRGFVFYTSYISKKALDIEINSSVALNFYWPQVFKQVKVRGLAKKTSRQETETYWSSRPKGSQISQLLSDQSQPVDSRDVLEARYSELVQQYADQDVPCPEDWGGYEVVPEYLEFWVGQENRLHDRFVFENSSGKWTYFRLQP